MTFVYEIFFWHTIFKTSSKNLGFTFCMYLKERRHKIVMNPGILLESFFVYQCFITIITAIIWDISAVKNVKNGPGGKEKSEFFSD